MSGWLTLSPTFPTIAMGVVLWLFAFGGALWRAHSAMACWRPTVLALSAFTATQMVVGWYLVFEFGDDVRKAGLPMWQGLVVGTPAAVLVIWGGQWLKDRIPVFASLRAKIAAKDDKVFPGERYPDKPLDFTVNSRAGEDA